jgi:hypothetical protein
VTVLTWLLLPHHGRWLSRSTPWLPPAMFATSALVLNSRTGRQFQERVVEAAGRALHQFHLHVIVGLLSWIVDTFRRAMDFVEGMLYAVDESLRFRSDESGLMLAIKAVLGAIWSIINATTFSFTKVNIVDGGESAQQFPSWTRQGSKVNAMFCVGSIWLKVLMANDM